MSLPRILVALLGASLVPIVHAAPQADASQPQFQPLRAKDPSKSGRVEKPLKALRLGIKARTEMHAVVGADGQIRLECQDASHGHVSPELQPAREMQ
ncbi:MAG: hypothetical protein LKM32_06500 [Chiayiivirga sp.]|jgi:hypothetical protein|uniref:hypothetical protein n=1 Tax=Chiayiivirga sp. TaxID=2041042 RepID=UPI0025C4EF91|nr:hypothetical protein [Chiayiivirga sp.]MCI1710170.1 hypothetical protein [Chiayiivirga sp.]MCI1729030.1 hypothetical protein [Chiayiivirga sp.]